VYDTKSYTTNTSSSYNTPSYSSSSNQYTNDLPVNAFKKSTPSNSYTDYTNSYSTSSSYSSPNKIAS
jgi:hypothetical protein